MIWVAIRAGVYEEGGARHKFRQEERIIMDRVPQGRERERRNDAPIYVDDRPQDGEFRVHRDVYADPELFSLEITHICEPALIFLGLDSQIPKPHTLIHPA